MAIRVLDRSLLALRTDDSDVIRLCKSGFGYPAVEDSKGAICLYLDKCPVVVGECWTENNELFDLATTNRYGMLILKNNSAIVYQTLKADPSRLRVVSRLDLVTANSLLSGQTTMQVVYARGKQIEVRVKPSCAA